VGLEHRKAIPKSQSGSFKPMISYNPLIKTLNWKTTLREFHFG